jgi:murein DD-endopeptidase MepM/ murein hydrolase activator NlpD
VNPYLSPYRAGLSKIIKTVATCLLVLLFTGCQVPEATPMPTHRMPVLTPLALAPQPPPAQAVETPPASLIEHQSLPSPTAVLSLATAQFEATEAPTLAVPTSASDPLRFVFPTPGPAPVSAWRPPLYSTPWAPSPYDHFYFSRPINADDINWPLWDYRYGGSFFADILHSGIDIPAPKGTSVRATGSGKVIWAGYGLLSRMHDPSDPYGLAVAILHDFGFQDQKLQTVYAHLDQTEVVRGQRVEAGDLIGYTGDTGHVTGPHLHFEVRLGKNDHFTARNPELWLVPPQGWGVLAGRVMNSYGQLKTEQMVVVTSRSTNQNWQAKTYGSETMNNDAYYRENVVISDLPAGIYEVRIAYLGTDFRMQIEIRPGLVTYFTFRGYDGFGLDLPPEPGRNFTPEPLP